MSSLASRFDPSSLLPRVVELLTPAVVENLPPYFQNIHSVADAEVWLKRMVTESLLFAIVHRETDSIAGFLFAHVDENRAAHIGYLLGESYWGRGMATESLTGFVDHSIEERKWISLIGGVDKSNHASSHLLQKLGFTACRSIDGPVVFYEYHLPRS